MSSAERLERAKDPREFEPAEPVNFATFYGKHESEGSDRGIR
jgi:hypothetical protein